MNNELKKHLEKVSHISIPIYAANKQESEILELLENIKPYLTSEGIEFWDEFIYMSEEETEYLDYDGSYEGYESWSTKDTTKFIREVMAESGIDALCGFPKNQVRAHLLDGELLNSDEVKWAYDKLFLIQDKLLMLYINKHIIRNI
ncbi:hypothetical protein LVD17_24820 [Fulvivirga ulvae]|uniref:hypothetical protein n=1 Tax=Fulvivirga ulvae TaxID=2904245 RepID=UPI001F216508|nr:hypothetical protein [Fulvivirga ulvae]UII31521.1 hypothetical protein LVD17_24820 [Fulvivirga ulvae]